MNYGGSFRLTKDTNIFDKKIVTYVFCNLINKCYFFFNFFYKEMITKKILINTNASI